MKTLEKRVKKLEEGRIVMRDPSEPRTIVLMGQVCKVKDGQIVERLGPPKNRGRWWNQVDAWNAELGRRENVENSEEKSV